MAPFSPRSLEKLKGVHPILVQLLTEVTQVFDCSILGGSRTASEQDANVAAGRSKTFNSKHLVQSDGFAHAVDAAPTPQHWDDSPRCELTNYEVFCLCFLFFVQGYATRKGVNITIGGDWNNDNILDVITNPKAFVDCDHIEMRA